jgi:hypothetical protein
VRIINSDDARSPPVFGRNAQKLVIRRRAGKWSPSLRDHTPESPVPI